MNKNDPKKSIKKRKIDPNSYKEYVVKKDCLLLDFLLEKYPLLSRNAVKNLLTHHQVSVGGAVTSQYNFHLAKEDTVIVSRNRIASVHRKNLPIIFENNEFVVIDKPAGLLSVASDNEKSRTAYRMVSDWIRQNDRHQRIYVVHRLDEDTSGVLLFAKDEKLRDLLQKDWTKLVSKRGYYAIVEGEMKKQEDTLIDYLKQDSLNLMRIVPKSSTAKRSITHYKVMKSNKNYSLLDVDISTGRKNQIRVQLGSRGHYVIGDDKYGEPVNPLKRLGLHAYILNFTHPITGKHYSFTSSMPKEFLTLFK